MEIAVLVNAEHITCGFEKDGTIYVYEKVNCEWNVKKQMEYCTKELADTFAFHQKIKEISTWMGECKIVVVNRIRGIHYLAFEEYQISMLEIKGEPVKFLDDIVDCLNHQRTVVEVPLEHNAIYERQPGKFGTDLRDVMNGKTSYNSKQILLPFLKNEFYSELEILCNHIPKWLEKEQTEMKIRITMEAYKDCMKVKVYPCVSLGKTSVEGSV